MNINPVMTNYYEHKTHIQSQTNKPNSNPINPPFLKLTAYKINYKKSVAVF